MKANKIIGALQGITKKWAKQRKSEERSASAEANREYAMTRRYHVSLKEAAWDVMEEAYLKASGGGSLPAHARQIMYAARPRIQELADRMPGSGFDKYFTQTLLPDYMEEYGCTDWNVVFDARGRFREPHTGEQVPLGTIAVGNYLYAIDNHTIIDLDFDISEERYPTKGPDNAYGAILFIEKEGFLPLFDAVQLAERYDLAIMSTKGMSVTASRRLIDTLGTNHDIPILVLHDFDKSGFSIVGTLQRDTRRYAFSGAANVIDIGLRGSDVGGLPSEYVSYGRNKQAIRDNLEQNGADASEIEFLLTRRVELNAFPSDEFVAWIEGKLKEHGVKKVVPDKETLTDAYHRMRRQIAVQEAIDEALEELGEEKKGRVPARLDERIRKAMKKSPAMRWDAALRAIAGKEK
jgi:DNA topoisomerase 6 subunit A-like protein